MPLESIVRLDLGLLQRDVAARLDVDVTFVMGWELGSHEPLTRHIPRIIEFLGYVPEELFPCNTTGQGIKRYRLLQGMTRKQLAKKLGMDEATLHRLEAGAGEHSANTISKISALVDQCGPRPK